VLKGKSNNCIGKIEIVLDYMMVMDSKFQTWREKSKKGIA
jgi:hypothetical protein